MPTNYNDYLQYADDSQKEIITALNSGLTQIEAAEKLGISRRTLQLRLKDLKESKPDDDSHDLKEPKVLFWDIETSPIFGAAWRRYDTTLLDITNDWYMLTYSYKWKHEKTAHVVALNDYEGYDPNSEDDFNLVSDLWELLDEADILVHHNGDKFDLKKANAKFIQHDLPPYSPVSTIDTLRQARKHFNFTSNKLDDLGKLLQVGEKVSHSGYSLWRGCMLGDEESWKKMKKYSKQDAVLLEKVYNKLLPWIKSTNLGRHQDGYACPSCGSSNVMKRGFSTTNSGVYQRYQCNDCSAWSRSRKKVKNSGNKLT